MKARKLLALLLTVLLIGGMLPTVFAEGGVEDEPVSVTFSFIKGGRSDVGQSSFETITNTDGVYTSSWTNYKNFPENPATPGENWAYAGSTVSGAVSANSFVNGSNYAGTGFVNEANQWLAFRVKVPKTATYELSELYTYKYGNSTSRLEVYMFPMDSEKFYEGSSIYGTVNAPATSTTYAYRTGVTTFNNLGIENPVLLGAGSEQASSGEYSNVALTDGNSIDLVAGEEYVLLFNNANNGKVITVTSVTLSEVTESDEEVPVLTEPEYNFTRSAITDTSITKIYNMTDSANLNREVSTGAWISHAATYISNSAIASDGAQFCGYKANILSGASFWVVRLSVDVPGYYTPEISFVKQAYCGLLDFWAVPSSVASGKGWSLENNNELKAAADESEKIDSGVGYIASIDTHSNSSEVSPLKGNSVYFEKDTYLVIRINKGSGVSTHKDENYYGYLKSVKLIPSDLSLELAASDISLRVGESTEITAAAKSSDGTAAEITSITYESLNEDVAKVNASTGVVECVGEGFAKIKAKAVVSGKELAAEITVTGTKVWDPKFVFLASVVKSQTGTSATPSFSQVTELYDNISTGIWKYVNMKNISTAGLYDDSTQYSVKKANFDDGNNAIVLGVSFDETGTYIPALDYMRRNYGGRLEAYLVSKSYADSKWTMTSDYLPVQEIANDSGVTKLASVNSYVETNESYAKTETGAAVSIDEKEAYLMFVLRNNDEGIVNDSNTRLWGLPVSLQMTRTGLLDASSEVSSLEINDTTTLSATVKDARNAEVTAEVTYENLTPAVVTLSGNEVTAIAAGEAAIKATATVGDAVVYDIVKVKVSPKKVSIATDIDGELLVKSAAIGEDVTITAPSLTGKVFRHWVLGTEENGIPVSTNASYTFKAVTNTYLTAVYSDEVAEDAKVVEFYLENGGYVGSAVANESGTVTLPDEPTLTGYEFISWMTDAETVFDANTVVTDAITKVVGTFNAATISEGVSYGDPIKNEAATAKLWKRDGKTVAYGTSYTYYVWGASTIEAVDGEKPAIPIIVLDEEVKADNARMIEYDAAGSTIIEAGIIFGNGTNMTVDSCMYKAKSKLNKSHGQFTAKPPVEEGYTTAIGYIVYVDNNEEYKVVYSE